MRTLTIAETAIPGLAYAGWVLEDLNGWNATSNVKTDTREKPRAHGAFRPRRVLRTALSFDGRATFYGSSVQEVRAAVEALTASVVEDVVPVTVDDDDEGAWTRHCRVLVTPEDDHGEPQVTVAFEFVAYDPMRYGVPVSAETGLPVEGGGFRWPIGGVGVPFIKWGPRGNPGTVVLTNTGTVVAYPMFEVYNGRLGGGFELIEVETSRRLRFEREVLDGQSIYLDAKARRANVEGLSDVTTALTVAQWPSIPPGASRTYRITSLGAFAGSPKLRGTIAPSKS